MPDFCMISRNILSKVTIQQLTQNRLNHSPEYTLFLTRFEIVKGYFIFEDSFSLKGHV